MIPDANSLVSYIEDFTGSSNNEEVKQCIYLAELMMRNIELPGLRTDPYSVTGVANSSGYVPIPADLVRPILFFNQGNSGNNTTGGPWIVYDRIGDRDMIGDQMLQNLYLTPYNVPQVYRGKFAEVGQYYQFLPALGEGAIINMYYFTTWPLLFSLDTDDEPTLNNVVLESFPEGYIYATLHNYYYKRKMSEDADKWLAKFNLAWDTIEDQNSKGKWSGGHNKLTSVFQPRRDRRFGTR
tara:strand:- start:513 stop:1229 length:717 start_codon:yes stop_codon:yes gene_type:complete